MEPTSRELAERIIEDVFQKCPEPPNVLTALHALEMVQTKLVRHYEQVCAARAARN